MSTALIADRATVRDDRRRIERRAAADRLVDLAQHLAPADRTLIEAIYRDGRSVAELARLMGVPRRTLQSRVAALVRR
ncbi:MAG: sigma factor-like helix-turn-helix DNA-binding protein, partial [Planctomycetota bacterium]